MKCRPGLRAGHDFTCVLYVLSMYASMIEWTIHKDVDRSGHRERLTPQRDTLVQTMATTQRFNHTCHLCQSPCNALAAQTITSACLYCPTSSGRMAARLSSRPPVVLPGSQCLRSRSIGSKGREPGNHPGPLQPRRWCLPNSSNTPCVQAGACMRRYGLRFSGHSLGAGAAALATHLLRTQPHRFPSLLTTFPRPQVDCFCAAAPPVLSLDLARASADYITTLTLGHDVVARASIANLEQLRLEVLTSGWWEEMVDPVVKSRTFQNVQAVLERVGAKELVLLARNAGRAYDERRAAAVGDAGNDAATPPRSMIVSALDRLHEVYTAPTVRSRCRCRVRHACMHAHPAAARHGRRLLHRVAA